MKLNADGSNRDVVRNYLWWWCSRASGKSRIEHQKLSREIPDDMLELEDFLEFIEMEYESEYEEDDEDAADL